MTRPALMQRGDRVTRTRDFALCARFLAWAAPRVMFGLACLYAFALALWSLTP